MRRTLFVLALLLFPVLALGQATPPPTPTPTQITDAGAVSLTYNLLNTATAGVASSLQRIGIKLFFALTVLQLVITGYGQVASGEIEVSLAKFGRGLIWTSFCLFLMTNNAAANFISNTIQYFLNHAIGWATQQPGVQFDIFGILGCGLSAIRDVVSALTTAATANSPGFISALIHAGETILATIYSGLLLIIIVIVVLLTCAYVALKVFMVKIEAVLVVAVLPLSLSFLGLNALRDQGFAPFKSMLALVYRIVILGMVVGGMASIGTAIRTYANTTQDANPMYVLLLAVFGFVMMAFIAHKSDQIASSLASGSASLGSGDAVGAGLAAAAGAGAVAGAVTGGAAAATSMGDFMKGLSGGGGASVSNASSTGAGSTPTPPAAPAKPNASMGGEAAAGSPKRGADSGSPQQSGSSAESSASAPAAPESKAGGEASSGPAAAAASPSDAGPSASGGEPPASPAGGESTGAGQAQAVNEPSGAPAASGGSGETAAIEGAPQKDLAGQVGDLVQALNAPKKASALDKAAAAAQHVAQEKHATQVSINTHGE